MSARRASVGTLALVVAAALSATADADGRRAALRPRRAGSDDAALPPSGDPLAHGRDWRVRHRWVAADAGAACASCHVERDCTSCHDARVRPRTLHPNDYLTTHVQLARRESPRCMTCHNTQMFCGECHARIGVSTVAAPEVSARAPYHPTGSRWIRGPGGHEREAVRALATCASCHTESDCVACHGARTSAGSGSGSGPHSAGFMRSCGRLRRANDRACHMCHEDEEALRASCP